MTRSSKALLGLLASLVLVGCTNVAKQKPDRPPAPVVTGKTAAEPIVAGKDANGQFEDALAALKAKKLPEARAGFERLAKENPEFSGPLTNLGILDAKANKRDAALTDFSRAVAANPRNAVAYNWLGILYRENGNYVRAEQSYLQSLSLNPDNPAVVLNLGILYDLYLNRPTDALARYGDYQRLTNNRELKVAAWIKALEVAAASSPAAAVPASTAPAAAKPVAKPAATKK